MDQPECDDSLPLPHDGVSLGIKASQDLHAGQFGKKPPDVLVQVNQASVHALQRHHRPDENARLAHPHDGVCFHRGQRPVFVRPDGSGSITAHMVDFPFIFERDTVSQLSIAMVTAVFAKVRGLVR